MNESLIKNLENYFKENIFEFEHRYETAYSIACHNRCSIQNVDYNLYVSICDFAQEYCYEYEIDYEDIQEELEYILF